jgi:hypothetical protein
MPIARCVSAALIFGLATAAQAQTVPVPGQEPKPEAGTNAKAACIEENDGYKMHGKQPMFEIALENKCEQRMRCKVFVYITSAKGVSQGRGTLVLAPKSQGPAAKKSYIMRAKMHGGSSQSARECRTF